jgi:hypothetical protein
MNTKSPIINLESDLFNVKIPTFEPVYSGTASFFISRTSNDTITLDFDGVALSTFTL